MTADTSQQNDNLLAWHGLEIPLREDWRPLKMEGDHDKGSITIGDIRGPVFQLRWIRPPKGYDGQAWIETRRESAARGQKSENPPHPPSFQHVSWIKNLVIRQEAEKTVWWGCSQHNEVLVEVLLTNLCEDELNEWFIEKALPKLRVISKTQDCPWQIYSARCRVPAGYILQRKRLATGDITLEFVRGKQERLLVRQVFPAKLALERRSFAGWMRDRVFTEHRRFKHKREQKPSRQEVTWTGWKRLPFPLGWVRPKRCISVIHQDEHLDRLLMVESEWTTTASPPRANDILSSMRWRRK